LPGDERFDCPAQQSILSAAHSANILISYSCRSGQCGSCLGKLHAGRVSYPRGRPDALNEKQIEEGYTLFCSAYASSDLVIELLVPQFAD
jgi:CDP-4-dehydro-6-deoxyglucose reductase